MTRASCLILCRILLLAVFIPGAFAVERPDYLRSTERLRLSFVGDCTLGSEEQYQAHPRNFVTMVDGLGFDHPFSGVRAVFFRDDLTLINLEGVFTDRTRAEDRAFVFRAPARYAQILPLASIEAVNLANNHTYDYGESGLADTRSALSSQGVLYSGNGALAIHQVKGVKIGMTGYNYPHDGTPGRLERDIAQLREMGCQVVIVSLHAGREEHAELTVSQERTARAAIDLGADIVVGHHPHVLQAVELYQGKPIFYSLGNFSFGGNANPSDWDTMIAQVEFDIHPDGSVTPALLRVLPCVISTATQRNDYRPVLADAHDRRAILDKLQSRSVGLIDPVLFENGELILTSP